MVERLTGAPGALALCPQTTSHTEAVEWTTTWTELGVEGVVAKRSGGRYLPGTRGWLKYRARSRIRSSSRSRGSAPTEAILGGVTGTLTRPESLLLG